MDLARRVYSRDLTIAAMRKIAGSGLIDPASGQRKHLYELVQPQ